eukprot:192529-Rhodomonas_salina.2
MSSTDACDALYAPTRCPVLTPAMPLVCYALFSAHCVWRYAMSGTDIGYAATRSSEYKEYREQTSILLPLPPGTASLSSYFYISVHLAVV